MGTAESTQSSELGAIAGLTNQSSFHQQSPNVARLIKSETSSKMEYEFPISDVSSANPSHQHGGTNLSSNHSILPSNNTRFAHSSLHQTNSLNSSNTFNHSGSYLSSADQRQSTKTTSPHQTSNLWSSLTSCFGCRTRDSNDASMNPLRDKVHAIRIVRASNDLTPAVFDSHYNIITLEQLRECDNNGSGNINSAANDFSDPLTSVNSNVSAQNGNGSVIVSSSAAAAMTTTTTATAAAVAVAGGKKDTSHRMKKKKKKRATTATYSSKPTGTDDEDDEDESGRT